MMVLKAVRPSGSMRDTIVVKTCPGPIKTDVTPKDSSCGIEGTSEGMFISNTEGIISVDGLLRKRSKLGVWTTSPLSDSKVNSREGVTPDVVALSTAAGILGSTDDDEGASPGFKMLPTTSIAPPSSGVSVGLTRSPSINDGRILGGLKMGVGSFGSMTIVWSPFMMLVLTILFSPSTDAIVWMAGN